MKSRHFNLSVFSLLLLVTAALLLNGCATPDTDNASVRPWNAPKSWENGLPSTMTEGR